MQFHNETFEFTATVGMFKFLMRLVLRIPPKTPSFHSTFTSQISLYKSGTSTAGTVTLCFFTGKQGQKNGCKSAPPLFAWIFQGPMRRLHEIQFLQYLPLKASMPHPNFFDSYMTGVRSVIAVLVKHDILYHGCRKTS